MNYATIKSVDIANGPGVRVSLFVSGCTHHCKDCFNEEAWDFHYGQPFTEAVEEEILGYLDHDYITGITLLGGEPMEPQNQERLLPFIRKVRERFPDKSIWCYTGYDFEQDILGRMFDKYPFTESLVELFDVMVDGKFVAELRNLSLQYRGSENQRILDVKQSLEARMAVWCEAYR
ncbi:MAG: anaerobic ribonucleoside-triphosphate reductase activating protein [Lachnospiraceae bacterium]|nr:anaerobic ribonucleoside-triphosphate reductase activating protein [Lachnospiraceae bacterium]